VTRTSRSAHPRNNGSADIVNAAAQIGSSGRYAPWDRAQVTCTTAHVLTAATPTDTSSGVLVRS
jgi:hypothetical protein